MLTNASLLVALVDLLASSHSAVQQVGVGVRVLCWSSLAVKGSCVDAG